MNSPGESGSSQGSRDPRRTVRPPDWQHQEPEPPRGAEAVEELWAPPEKRVRNAWLLPSTPSNHLPLPPPPHQTSPEAITGEGAWETLTAVMSPLKSGTEQIKAQTTQ